MFKKIGLILVVLSCFLYATPSWMWIGTYAITDGPTPWTSLSGCDQTANAFYNAAVNNHPNGPTPNRTINLTDKNVTLASSTWPDREMCDFLWMGSHGYKRGHCVWNAQGDYVENWPTTTMAFGTNYVRWVYLSGCHTLIYDDFNSFFYGNSSWDPAFEGVQCILGFYSIGYVFSTTQPTRFWERWTGNGTSAQDIWTSHCLSTREGYYDGGWDIAPAIVTSRDESGHFFWDDTYEQATSTRGVSWATGTKWYVYGDPL